MSATNSGIPMRAVIRCKARQLLHQNFADLALMTLDDEELLHEVATTFFSSEVYQQLRQQCKHEESAPGLEDEAAQEIVNTFRSLKARQQQPLIQRLNAML